MAAHYVARRVCAAVALDLFSIRSCATVLVVYLDHIVVDTMCVRKRLEVLDLSVW